MRASDSTRTAIIAQVALLCSVIVLMAFTPLGYARIGPVEATLLMIPVAIGAIQLGPLYGGLLGAVFGLTSFAQCFGASPFGTLLMSIDPLATFVVCLVPRIAMGLCVGALYALLARRRARLALPVAFLCASLLNTVFFVTLFLVLFGSSTFVADMQAGRPLLVFLASFIGINGIAEALISTIGGSAIGSALQRALGSGHRGA